MLNHAENERLTSVGPGTPGGELLRRYWHPIAAVDDLTDENPKKKVRILGEDLVLYRDGKGRLGLIEEQCPHRSASFLYGFIEEDGIRCPYHGWKFDCTGECLEMPFEPDDSPLQKSVKAKTYPVEVLSGLVFAYMGPAPAPLLPRWDALVRDDVERVIHILPELECNWLQVMENSVDPTHTYFLHAHSLTLQGKDNGAFHYREIKGIDFVVKKESNWAGVIKKRIYEGETLEDNPGHPVIFPTILLLPPHPNVMMHFRVPVDDTHTQIFRCQYTPTEDGSKVPMDDIIVSRTPDFKDEDGEYHFKTFGAQDAMAWETQGPVTDREREILATGDRGIAYFRKLLREQIDAVEAGQDPVGVIRDPALNERIVIELSDQQGEFRAKRMAGNA
ncbi:MAG: Rieske 2Fe-2S domain-containing protein [Rhodospirillales bacterium]|jgi:5,5'-dehydrodivanillate O-demethylase oxygenase subunit|nr:Rieske 2Fe-2S domain-containing protein [Rhodospirillales bacterium]MBT4007298.1 Rieske 2Fe-2S domain-containing protein [Rhodospirillales bacterium]MBT5076997.1 Rieske 2Fe-2S domain-containing protein [Rhodospirillales bacterium]MBT5113631.1 Rieske 2Fe-2S domain-containing protein [Rhodospirillales bacterium]MBT5673929.1 Rieske 2Fe-2S domain-containing protein [Rhodospirillales bacterium]